MSLTYCKNLRLTRLATVSVFLALAFLFASMALAATEAELDAAMKDLSAATGQSLTSHDQAKALCNQEQYFDVCAEVGKKHGLYTEEEKKQVDSFLAEVKGQILNDIKNCSDEECLGRVASELAKKLQAKNSTLATDFKLTNTIVAEKQAVVQAAKEAGVNFKDCESMDPDTASLDLLRKCARLAKDTRVQKYIPEEKRAASEQFSDKTIALKEALSTGKYQCGDNTFDGCGRFCLSPTSETKSAGIPQVCKQIATEVFGSEGIKELERAHQQVGQVKDYYSKKFILTLPDGRELVGEGQIRNACDQAFSSRNIEIARACGTFAVNNGFASKEEVEKGLKLMESFTQKGQNTNFDQCLSNPEACRDFIPEEDRAEFEAGRQIFEIMRTEIGFDPSQCERGSADPTIGDACFNGAKRALAKIENLGLAQKSKEARFIVEDIKRHVADGDDFANKKDQFEQTFQRGGGPGGCKSEAECFAYCSDPKNGPECISFGAKQGRSGFRGGEAVEKFQEYNKNLQRPGLGSDEYREFSGQGPFQGFQPPGQGGYPPGQIPGFTQPGPGLNPLSGTGPNFGPVGPSPECFIAIQSGDFVKAKAVCETSQSNLPVRPLTPICPALPYIECPAGQYRDSFQNRDGCWIDGPCKPSSSSGPYPTYSSGPYPTYNSKCPDFARDLGGYCQLNDDTTGGKCAVYSAAGNKDNYSSLCSKLACPAGQAWSYTKGVCVTNDYPSYSPYPTYTYTPYPTSTGGSGELYSCFYPNATKNGKPTGYTVWCEKDYFNCREGSKSGSAISLDGLALGAPSSCERGYNGQSCNNNKFCDSNETSSSCPSDCSSTSYSPAPVSCSQSLINLLGSGCHYMYSDSSSRAIYCNNEMTKSAKEGDSVTTAGCSGGGSTYTPYPTYTTSYSPYPSPSGSCPSTFAHDMGGYCMLNEGSGCAAYSVASNKANYSSDCSKFTSATPTPTPTTTYTYSPYPTTSSGSCPSGAHSMASYCMSDADGTKCGPFGSTSVSVFGSCSTYQGTTSTYTPYPTCPSGQWWDTSTSSCKSSTYTYTPYPTTSSTSSSCPSGSHLMDGFCMSDADLSKCGPFGSTSVSSFGSCSSYNSTTATYTPYPTYTSTYTPYPTSTYTPEPTATPTPTPTPAPTYETTYTPYPTTEYTPTATYQSCPSGQYWNGSSCVTGTSVISGHHMAMNCLQQGKVFNGSKCKDNGLFAKIYEGLFVNTLKLLGF